MDFALAENTCCCLGILGHTLIALVAHRENNSCISLSQGGTASPSSLSVTIHIKEERVRPTSGSGHGGKSNRQ